jgi:hypothetical protein
MKLVADSFGCYYCKVVRGRRLVDGDGGDRLKDARGQRRRRVVGTRARLNRRAGLGGTNQ